MKKNIKFLSKTIIAHRGIFDNINIPENSIGSFKEALKKGLCIELDVHLLKDNTIVVFHDDNIKRLTNINKMINSYTFDELNKVFLLNTNYKIPTLNEVLKLIDGKVPLIIELKNDNCIGKLEKHLIKILDNYSGDFAVKSFNPFTILWFRLNRPNYIRGSLINYKYKNIKEYITNKMIFNFLANPDFLSVNYKFYDNKKIMNIKNKKPVIAWTINNKDIYNLVKDNFTQLICENII